VVRLAADAARATTSPIVVVGFAGPAGGASYNRALSEARAKADAAAAREAARGAAAP
jgi:outer membrane protein OmpA-like peptidoglycan-associated protein